MRYLVKKTISDIKNAYNLSKEYDKNKIMMTLI